MRVLPSNVSRSDQELVSLLRRAEPRAFAQVYERYSARLLGFLLRLTGRRDVAEDVFQNTWCSLAEASCQLNPAADLYGWLLRVARNDYYDHRRREVRSKEVALSDAAAVQSIASVITMPDQASAAREECLALERALLALSDVDREVLLLVGVEGISHERSAEVLGIAEPTMRKRLSRARERLEQQLDQLQAEPTSIRRSMQ